MTRSVLAGASARVDPLTFSFCLKSLRGQRLPESVRLDLHYILDDPEPAALAALIEEHDGTWELADPRPDSALYGIAPDTHKWNAQTFAHLAKQKQKLLDKAVREGYDYVWIVDTDLICDPATLASMLALKEQVVSAVFWTPWLNGSAPMPQVWLAQPYEQQGMGMSQGEFWDKLTRRKVVPVAGGGACMLVRTEALKKTAYWPLLQGLPQDQMWQGEDRTFAIRCQRNHLTQVADGWPDIYHCYHIADRQPEALENIYAVICGPRQKKAGYGDLVSFTLESLDDPGLADRTMAVRGRLGGLWLAPEIESALLDMAVGTRRFLEVLFPVTWPLEALRGQRRVMQIELVDVKPFGFAPQIADVMLQGVQRG